MEVRKIVHNIFFKPLTIIQSYKIQKLLQILLHKAHKLMWQWMWFDIVIDVIGGFQLPNKWMFDFILFFILWLVTKIFGNISNIILQFWVSIHKIYWLFYSKKWWVLNWGNGYHTQVITHSMHILLHRLKLCFQLKLWNLVKDYFIISQF